MPHPNETLIREFFELFARRDVSTAARLFSDDVVLHVPGRNPFSGIIYGREAWLRSLLKYAEAESAGITLSFEVHDVVGGDEHTVALLNILAEREGERFEWQRVAVYHIRDSAIREVWIHDVDQHAIDEFFHRALK